MKEEWKDIEEFPGYAVSNLGNFFSYKTEKLLKLGKSTNDASAYPRVYFYKEGRSWTRNATRLVATYFIPNPNDLPEVNHLDGNKFNIQASNLEWSTKSDNMLHAYATNLKTASPLYGEENKSSKITQEIVDYIRKVYVPRHHEYGARPLARKIGICHQQVSRIANNKSWKE